MQSLMKKCLFLPKLEDLTAADAANEKKMSDSNRGSPEVKELRRKIDELQGMVKTSPCLINTKLVEHIKALYQEIKIQIVFSNRMSQKMLLKDYVD